MKILKKLQNPFALVAQGFVAGSVIFYATTPAEFRTQQAPTQSEPASGEELRRA